MENTRSDPKRPRILLADDHKMVAEGLKRLLTPQFDLVGTVDDGLMLLKIAPRCRPDVIVADIAMPGLSGLDAWAVLRRRDLAVRMVFLTMHRDMAYLDRAQELGASGFVLKHEAPEELVRAVWAVLEGRTFFTSTLARRAESGNGAMPKAGSLTHRQQQILRLLSEGRSAKEIGKALNISSRTVEFHKYRIMEVHGLQTTAELIHLAIRHGLILS